jgi:hypothetical protein
LSEERVLLEVSEAVVESTGWPRRLLQGSAVGREDGPRVSAEVACPLWVQHQSTSPSLKYLKQYPATKLGLRGLFSGEQRKAELTFRMWMADGRVLEIACTAWQTEASESDAQGSSQHHVALTWAMEEGSEVPT